MFNWSIINQGKAINESEYRYEKEKQFADKYAEATIIAQNEKDPVKREKMYMRLAFLITDFSDL